MSMIRTIRLLCIMIRYSSLHMHTIVPNAGWTMVSRKDMVLNMQSMDFNVKD